MKFIQTSFRCCSWSNDIPDSFEMSIDRDQEESDDVTNSGKVTSLSNALKAFRCKKCSQRFANIELLHSHLQFMHNIDFVNSSCSNCMYCLDPLLRNVLYMKFVL